jgi:hypothetical protein
VKFGMTYDTGYYGTDPGNMAAIARHAENCSRDACAGRSTGGVQGRSGSGWPVR